MRSFRIGKKNYYFDQNLKFLFDSISKDYYLKYKDDFKCLVCNCDNRDIIKISLKNESIDLDVSDSSLHEWEKLIKKIQTNELNNLNRKKNDYFINNDTISNSLRKRKNQQRPKNDVSKCKDKKIMKVVYRVMVILEKKHHELRFEHDRSLYLKDLIFSLKKENPDFDFEDVLPNSHILPDGGILYMIKNGIKHPILVSEEKQQGTNDLRINEGLSKQSKGNAVERLAKNLKVIELLFSNEKINPFICFLQGCDFHPTESIVDRAKSIFHFLKKDTINLYKKKLGDINVAGTYFMYGNKAGTKEKRFEWDEEFMFEKMLEIADNSVYYYLNKYGE